MDEKKQREKEDQEGVDIDAIKDWIRMNTDALIGQ